MIRRPPRSTHSFPTRRSSDLLLSAIVGGLVMKYNPVQLVSQFVRTIWLVRYSLITIVLMLALGTLTRYSGTDTTLGLAFANTRSEEHTSELQSQSNLVCRLLLEKKKKKTTNSQNHHNTSDSRAQ